MEIPILTGGDDDRRGNRGGGCNQARQRDHGKQGQCAGPPAGSYNLTARHRFCSAVNKNDEAQEEGRRSREKQVASATLAFLSCPGCLDGIYGFTWADRRQNNQRVGQYFLCPSPWSPSSKGLDRHLQGLGERRKWQKEQAKRSSRAEKS